MHAFKGLKTRMYIEGAKKSTKVDMSKHTKPRIVMMPTNTFRRIWENIVHLLLLYTALFVPYKICFAPEESDNVKLLDKVVDILFGLDLFLNFTFAYERSATAGDVESRLGHIAINYFKGWFIIDFMACFPFELIINAFIPDLDSIKST
jgi:hypothetical protein